MRINILMLALGKESSFSLIPQRYKEKLYFQLKELHQKEF